MGEGRCELVASLGPEVALGIADGEERAVVLAHLEHCPTCRHLMRQLGEVVEGLTDLVPPVEPPPGFESRVLDSVGGGAEGPGVADRRWWTPLRAVATVAAAAVIGVGGWLLGGATAHTPRPAAVTSAALLDGHRRVGEVVVAGGADPWLSMAVEAPLPATTVRCEIRIAGGRVATVGSFSVGGGYAYWSGPLPRRTSVQSARIVSPSGTVLATATFGTPTSGGT